MRASLIALVALVASPLMIFAAPSSQIGSLAERDDVPSGDNPLDKLHALSSDQSAERGAVPPGGNLLDNLDALTPDQLADHILALPYDKARELANKLSDKQAFDLINRVKDSYKSNKIIERVGNTEKIRKVLFSHGA